MDLNTFIKFDPSVDNGNQLPEVPGNYIVLIRNFEDLPELDQDMTCQLFHDLDVIYTGVAGTSLRTRIWKNHLGGNAGHSTLRLSLGCLFGYTLIPRDKNDINNGHVRFNADDEKALTAWMMANLIFYYIPNDLPEIAETELIDRLNPPLNLSKNSNPENMEFRLALSELRCKKPWLEDIDPELPEVDFNLPMCRVFRVEVKDFSHEWETIEFQFDHVTLRLELTSMGPEPISTLIHGAVDLTDTDPVDEYNAEWVAEHGPVLLGIHRDGDAILFQLSWEEMDDEGERQSYRHQFKIRLSAFLNEIKREAKELILQYGIVGFGANWAGYENTYDTFPLASLLKLYGLKLLRGDESPMPCSNYADELRLLQTIMKP